MDVHASHDVARARVEREARRVELGKLRDVAVLLEREAVKCLEQEALDRDKAEQMRVAEDLLADVLRRERRALQAHSKRRHALRRAVYGEETLFTEGVDVTLAFHMLKPPDPIAHATVPIDAYTGMLGVGGARAWECVARRAPCIGGLLVPGPGSMASWLQVLLRLPAVMLWVQAHVKLCVAQGAADAVREGCVTCALWAMYKRLGKHTYALEEVRPLMLQRPSGPAAYIGALLAVLRDSEVALGRCSSVPMAGPETHVDRLFHFWVETRRECLACGRHSAVIGAHWEWCLGAGDVDEAEIDAAKGQSQGESVADMYLRSCAVKGAEVECSSAACAGRVTRHRQQMRMRTLPNVLLVRVDRGVNDGSHARFPVTVDGELSFPKLGANLVLAAVLYQIPDRVAGMRYACACAAVDGEFWYYDGDLEPCCLGPDVAARLPRHGVYCVYHVRGGAAAFEGAVNRVVEQKRPGWRSVGPGKEDTGGVARSSGDGAPSALARQLERTERLARIATLATEFYMDESMDVKGRVVRVFRDMYFERLEPALPFFARVWLYRLVRAALRAGGGLVQLEPEGVEERVVSRVVGYLVPALPQGSAAEAFLEFLQLCLVTQVSKDEVQRAIVPGDG